MHARGVGVPADGAIPTARATEPSRYFGVGMSGMIFIPFLIRIFTNYRLIYSLEKIEIALLMKLLKKTL